MDTTARRRKIQKSVISDSLPDLYPHDLNMYLIPPGNSIVLNEFEDLALERVQLFRILEQASLKGHKQFSEDWKKCVKEDLAKIGLKKYVRLINGFSSNAEHDHQARRADHISHFILRLAYCRSEDLRRWFLNRELEWFKFRFISQPPSSIKKFLEINNLTYLPISHDEKEMVKEDLIASTSGYTSVMVETNEFFKIPFTDVCPLVKNRKVYLKGGFAYVSSNDLVVCIQSKFRAHLSEALNVYQHRLPLFDDDRINPLLSNLHNVHTGNNYTVHADKKSIDPANLDLYSKKHFPLCMRHIHGVLRSTHHLKHGCRFQYGLFLKGIGLLYEDALTFFRDEFTKIMDSNKFNKEYTYNVKHQYGKVGSMINYSPYSCIKVIMGSVGPGEHHGCPFRHWDPALLKQKLGEYGMSSDGVEEIKELVNNGHFQLACTKYFELTHGKAPTTGINHPNQYFEESMGLEKAGKEENKKN